MVTKVYLVRHVQALGNMQRIFQGSLDLDLSEVGIKQLECVKDYFKNTKVDIIYSSPLIRAKRTAGAVSEATGIKTINFDDRLKEINLGELEGLPIAEFEKSYPEPKILWETKPHMFEPIGGEKMSEVYDRIKNAVLDIVSDNKGKNIAIVSHGCAMRNFLAYALGKNIEYLKETPWTSHGTIAELEFEEDEVVSVNTLNIQAD